MPSGKTPVFGRSSRRCFPKNSANAPFELFRPLFQKLRMPDLGIEPQLFRLPRRLEELGAAFRRHDDVRAALHEKHRSRTDRRNPAFGVDRLRVDADLALHPEEDHRREWKRRQAGEIRHAGLDGVLDRRERRVGHKRLDLRIARRVLNRQGGAHRDAEHANPLRIDVGARSRVLEPGVEIGHFAETETERLAIAAVVSANREVEYGEAMPAKQFDHAQQRAAVVLVTVHGDDERAARRWNEPAGELQAIGGRDRHLFVRQAGGRTAARAAASASRGDW